MNIIIFCSNNSLIKNLNFLNNISIISYNFNEKDKLFDLCTYLITDNISIIYKYPNLEKIFIPYHFISNIDYLDKFIIVDNNFNNYYFENNILITENNNYIIKQNKLYLFEKETYMLYNKLYINQYYLSELITKNKYIYEDKLLNNIKIVKFKKKDLLNYGIISYNNNYYYKIFNKYLLINIDELILNLPIDFEFIYVEEKFDEIVCKNNFINLKINLIFIIDENNIKNSIYNIKKLLNENYDNYNIIIFLNNVINNSFSNLNKSNIYIFNSSEYKLNIDILIFLIKLSDNNSLIAIIDNKYLMHPNFSLNYINLLFISKKLLLSDIYSNDFLNILIFKKELFFIIENVYNILKENDTIYLSYLYNIFNKIESNHFYLKKYSFDYHFDLNMNIDINNVFDNNLYFYLESTQLNLFYSYSSMFFDNYSKNKIALLDYTINNYVKNNADIYLNLLLYIYKNNNIFYQQFYKNLKLLLKNINSKIQIILFFDENDNIEYIENKIKLLQDNLNAHINIIHFNNNYYDLEKYNINYIFLNTTNLDKKYKSNKSLAYNIILQIFQKYLFTYNYIILYDVQCNINSKIINNYLNNINNIFFNNNLDIVIIKNKIFEKVGGFDPEIFIENSKYEIIYFLEKIKKLNLEDVINLENMNIVHCNKTLYNNFYNNINNIINNNACNKNIITNFFQYKNLIDYHIFNKIKIVIINLEERTDRLKNIIIECNKLNLQNYDIFKGIKIDDEHNYLKYNSLLNKNKMWKKDNIDYFKSALGCKISHLEVLKKYKDINNDYLLILEDDVIFEENVIIYLNLALFSLKKINWDILFLSTNLKEKNDAFKIDDNLLKINKGLTTTAQLFNKNNIEKMIEVIENSDLEIDNTYNNFLKEKYCVYPMCVYQKESYSDINKKIVDYGKFHKKFKY